MKDINEFKRHAHEVVEWIARYFEEIENYPVKSQVEPGEIDRELPDQMPEQGENISQILSDFDDILMKGITHWQSPKFFAYFPANSSLPSLLAEMITAAIGAQCMKWETSPAAAELEEKVMNWLKGATGLPVDFQGTIQDSASTATLVSLLTAREKFTDYRINEEGFRDSGPFRIYCSEETHSSIEKGVKIAGFGRENLVRVEVDDYYRLRPDKLDEAIERDQEQGRVPLCIIATIGTTGSTAIDPLAEIARIRKKHKLWLHVDAAYAGSTLILPEYQWMIKGVQEADTFVFNPHKWLFTNFDCSAYFVRDKQALVRTFQLVPEYLKTRSDEEVNNYSDWTIPLGRRFRALKLWFVLRYYGLEGLQQKLREHIAMAGDMKQWIEQHD
ncbi:MAG: aminotransferase class I/II-fold pyridoxal phosphate-dependent enzyme, partial [Bacteroidales bacterium]|nr:aminotransferase class I/II-fold pyridoxal phosphate-dependent enzyme [Bacteroidales bacterium]